MKKSLLFLPDISGFTEFVQTTEVSHSQHVIAEVLEVLLEANTLDLQLAEIEGDALFYYKEQDIPSLEQLLAQVETMFTAFYSHLKLLEKNRVCPCNACSSAPNLQLKIIAHCGELQFITVQDKRKPFGTQVIEVHRLMKNTVESDNYVLLSKELADHLELQHDYHSKLFSFQEGENEYDGKKIPYLFSIINNEELKLKPFAQAPKININKAPTLYFKQSFPVSAHQLFEYISNYAYRHYWTDGVDRYEYDENEVSRIGTEHVCVVNGKHLNFVTVIKEGKPGQLVYGEMSESAPIADTFYQFYFITPQTENTCIFETEVYLVAKSPLKKVLIALLLKNIFRKNLKGAIAGLLGFVEKRE